MDLATCSSCSSPCSLVADGCGRGAVDFALTVFCSSEQQRWGEAGLWLHRYQEMIVLDVHTEPFAPQSVSSADLPTLGPVTV